MFKANRRFEEICSLTFGKETTLLGCLFQAFFFNPEDGSDIFLEISAVFQNIS
jgi:hypothetical protein